jgi:hypothetical protein
MGGGQREEEGRLRQGGQEIAWLPARAIAGIRRQHLGGGPDGALERPDAIPRIPQLALKPVLKQLDLGDVGRQLNVGPNGGGRWIG